MSGVAAAAVGANQAENEGEETHAWRQKTKTGLTSTTSKQGSVLGAQMGSKTMAFFETD